MGFQSATARQHDRRGQRTPVLASLKNSLISASCDGAGSRIKSVHGFLAGRLLVGVLAPALSVAGDCKPSSEAPGLASPTSGVFLPDLGGGLVTDSSLWS